MLTINPLYVHYMQTCALHAVRVLGHNIATSKRIGQRKFSTISQEIPFLSFPASEIASIQFRKKTDSFSLLSSMISYEVSSMVLARAKKSYVEAVTRFWQEFFQQYVALQRRIGSAHIVTKNERDRSPLHAMPR